MDEIDFISLCGEVDLSKVITSIPTKNGIHLITKPFKVETFRKSFPDIDVQKKNPTLLYYPKSLDK